MAKIAVIGFVLILASFLFPPLAAFAWSEGECNASYSGASWMFLECSPGFATPSDRVTIYSPTGFDISQPWSSNLDYSNSIWIFDAGSQGTADLIVDFHQEAGGWVADLYDDGNADGQVAYDLRDGVPAVRENNGNWSLRLIARDGWWARGGIVNYNLDILVDGKMQAAFVEDVRERLAKAGLLKTDGAVDFEIHVRDSDRDGKPDYEWRQKRYPLSEDPNVSGHVRTEIIANTEDDELPPEASVFWPYLSPQPGAYNKGRPGLPPIQVDWQRAAILQVAEFIRARSEPGSFSIYSFVRVEEGQTTTTDFENPFAFYDLANAGDGYPDLNIRMGVIRPFSPSTSRQNSTPLNDVQYAWDQYHTQHWDYQVGLAGRQVIGEIIRFPEFSVRAIPHAELPEWVTSQTWDMATFVQVEKSPYYSSEIVWEWNTAIGSDAVRRKYLPGITDAPPLEDFADIQAGFRGEVAFDYNSSPLLYFSPIDRKLHLLKAQAGVFRLDEDRVIQYQNLGGDYINQWTLMVNDQPAQSLFFGSGNLIFADNSSVLMSRLGLPPSLFTALPPRDHEEWSQLGMHLAEHRLAFAPDNFKAILEQFGAADVSITGASMRDLRLTHAGFRFVLELQDAFIANGEDWLGLKGIAPGEYLVSYDGAFHLEPLTPPDIQLTFASPQPPASVLTDNSENLLQLLVRNGGLQDATQLQVVLGASQPGQEIAWTEPQTVTVLAGETTPLLFPWAPEAPGEWKLRVHARLLDPEYPSGMGVSAERLVQVQPAQETTFQQEVSAFGLVQPWQVAALLLALALAAGLAAWAFSRLSADNSPE